MERCLCIYMYVAFWWRNYKFTFPQLPWLDYECKARYSPCSMVSCTTYYWLVRFQPGYGRWSDDYQQRKLIRRNKSNTVVGLFVTHHKVGSYWDLLALADLPQTEVRGHVVIRGLVPHTPSHIHHLELVPHTLAVGTQFRVHPFHQGISLMTCIWKSHVEGAHFKVIQNNVAALVF